MRKLALLLGSLLVVASASAKEVVPAPVVVEEAPVQVIEKEVIVYRDKEVGFRPNGNVDLQYRWYGETEGQGDKKKEEKRKDGWNEGANNYSRLQLSGLINMTEKQQLQYRIRNWNDVDRSNKYSSSAKEGTETRLRYFYNHGLLGDSKVDFTSRVQYRDKNSGAQDVEYMARFNFAEYMFNNDFVKTTDFTLAPRYAYVWGKNNADYDNQLGLDLYTFNELPYGFSFEFNVYATQHFFGKGMEIEKRNGTEDKNLTLSIEAYLYYTANLYTNGNVSVDFNFEGGYDAYNWSQEKKFGAPRRDGGKYVDKYDKINDTVVVNKDKNGVETKNGKGVGTDNSKYSLYALPTIQVNYQATPNVVVYAAAGAEYRDWAVNSGSSATNWRWQPTVFAGFKTTF